MNRRAGPQSSARLLLTRAWQIQSWQPDRFLGIVATRRMTPGKNVLFEKSHTTHRLGSFGSVGRSLQ